jgi:hypothetical protein
MPSANRATKQTRCSVSGWIRSLHAPSDAGHGLTVVRLEALLNPQELKARHAPRGGRERPDVALGGPWPHEALVHPPGVYK